MSGPDYSITFACYNQLDFTRRCVESMQRHGVDLQRVVAVDNCSADDTRDYLASLPLGGRIFNKRNLGCGTAWNQGALALQTEWTIVMNNDVVVSAGWIDKLIGTAERNGLKIISPAMIEGPLDYDFDAFAADAGSRMAPALRIGDRHAVCLAIHESVWTEVGYFRATPRLLGYEDALFFHEFEQAGVRCAMTGAAWLHHFGSITVSAMKQERGLSGRQALGSRRNYRLLQMSWLERKLAKAKRIRQLREWREQEIARYGMSLLGSRVDNGFVWR